MSLRTRSAPLIRTLARALASVLGRKPPADDTDGFEAWLDESFAR